MWWWLAHARKKMWWWIASFGKSYNGGVLQHAKQLFSLRIPQMTKFCVMRECDNIHSWISLSGDSAFSHQHGIYGFKFPKRFLEISFRDLTLSFLNPNHLRPDYQSIGNLLLCIRKAECSSQTFSQGYPGRPRSPRG